MDFITLIIAILGSGTAAGVISHFLSKKNVDTVTHVTVDKTSIEIRKIEQDIEAQYIEQLKKWICDLQEIQNKHEIAITTKDAELIELHKENLQIIKQLDEARMQLERSGRATQKLMAKIDTPYWEADSVGRLTYVNSAWLSLFGLAPDNVLGNKWMEVIQESTITEAKLAWYSGVIELNDNPVIMTIVNPVTKITNNIQFIFSHVNDTHGLPIKVIGVAIRLHTN
jgi:PAS domain-containing protein